MASVRRWIEGDESAKEMLVRVLTDRPLLLLPPLHRVPLRVGNIVEIIGPSPSAKTHILVQAAISCIVPQEWKGVYYGGLERSVMFFDLDCLFDILRLSQSLKHRILEANGLQKKTREQNDVDVSKYNSKERHNDYDKELFAECMGRVLYIRCYDSFEFLAALKVLHSKLEIERKANGPGVHLLMIDSIGAFNWIDRASSSLPQRGPNRKNLSLQNVSETVVQEIQKLLLVHPMLVLATKTAHLGDKYAASQTKRSFSSGSSRTASEVRNGKSGPKNNSYREYMPSIWQSFVTHRILVRASDDERKHPNQGSYLSEWLLPALNLTDEFIVSDVGIITSSQELQGLTYQSIVPNIWTRCFVFPFGPSRF